MGKGSFPEMDERHGFLCLRHSNWTICSPLSQFCSLIFHTFTLLYWGANSYYPRERKAENGKRELSRNGWEAGVSVPGAFKLDHLQPFKPILLLKFSNFLTFLLGANSYCLREGITENGNREFTSRGRSCPFKLDMSSKGRPAGEKSSFVL